MKPYQKCAVVIAALLCGTLLCGAPLWAQQNTPPPATAYATAPDIPYDSAPNFLKLPAGLYLGEGIGVATNSKGHVFVYTRSGDDAPVRVRSERHLRHGDRAGAVRLRVRARGPRRQGGQHLGGRRRHQHGHQVQPEGQAC